VMVAGLKCYLDHRHCRVANEVKREFHAYLVFRNGRCPRISPSNLIRLPAFGRGGTTGADPRTVLRRCMAGNGLGEIRCMVNKANPHAFQRSPTILSPGVQVQAMLNGNSVDDDRRHH
jgi:hypothetical protein